MTAHPHTNHNNNNNCPPGQNQAEIQYNNLVNNDRLPAHKSQQIARLHTNQAEIQNTVNNNRPPAHNQAEIQNNNLVFLA